MPHTLTPAVRAFLELDGGRAPDFSPCLILVPHHHAGLAFRQTLSAAFPGRHLLPPRLLTLPELAARAGLDLQPEADSLRLAQLRDFLEGTGQIPEASLWEGARELLALLNELDGLGASETVLARLSPRSNRYLSIEAGIAQAVWWALAKGGGMGRMRLHGLRLAWLGERADGPLYTLGLAGLNGVERSFLAAWRTRAPVIDLPTPPGDLPRLDLLRAVWEEGDAPLLERARRFRAEHERNPLEPDVSLLAAPGLEAGARAAERVLLDWLAAGMRNIALIALDRLMARRLRALLERRDILIQDETGWAFSTASASHAVECWLRLVTGDAWFRDLLDFLKSPFVFADAGGQRLQAAHELDDAFRRHGAPDGLGGHLDLARREGLSAAQAMLGRIDRARTGFTRGRHPLREWTRRLLGSLVLIAADGALRADPVGCQLLRLLERLAGESAGHEVRYGLADWRRWLFLHLEQSTFLDDTVISPLRLTHLAAAHTRELDGAILLGVGAAQLPGPAPSGIFNDAARAQLGLPGAAERETDTRAALADLMARTPRVALVWQSEQQGEEVPLSPWLVHLDAFHRAAWGSPWVRRVDSAPSPGAPPGRELPAPSPPLVADSVPERLSVSAWQSLVACPYQFHARHLLRLNERDEVPEEMDKADYGSLVHRILARFHDGHPVLEGGTADDLAADLRALGRQVFAEAESASYLASVWRLRWERKVQAYIEWALARERAGYRYLSAETPLARDVTWGEGRSTRLHGRADRLDERDGETALLDYKTQSRQTLKAKLEGGGEDVQLTAYAWLAAAGEAGFVTVDADKVETLGWKEGLAAAAEAEAGRLRDVLAGLAAGAPLKPQGAPATCGWCEMRGLCRRDHQA
jgi:ATP-dependent helicase/nuclease subunit B